MQRNDVGVAHIVAIPHGVSQQEPPLPPVRRAHVGCAEHVVGPPIAEVGQSPEYGSHRSASNRVAGIRTTHLPWCRSQTGDVFEEDPRWLHLADDSLDVVPEPSGIGVSLPLAGGTERLAWEASNDCVHDLTPRDACERRGI